MKGTLLLLSLLVIGELGFQTTEACFPFFGLYFGIISGSKLWLHHELSYFNPTPEETEAYEKIQNCFNEAGSLAKLRDIKVMATLLFSSECKTYYSEEVLTKIKAQFTQALNALGYDGVLDNSSS
ncbi:secretoglobin family 2B member 2-like isoform X2 [Rattus rattus]|uniref:secretoglobin family 2B member 2-like isoform X2 n=1 Tax=Rattus rattus TaxID=10117 RepID=UPI0013F36C60|nr:secretoglobin family 2B member 2-like isoform X2 [Rattus rattus]